MQMLSRKGDFGASVVIFGVIVTVIIGLKFLAGRKRKQLEPDDNDDELRRLESRLRNGSGDWVN
jgi:hypothetical protein